MAYSFSMIGQHVYMDCVVFVTMARSFACAPRWGVALIGLSLLSVAHPVMGTTFLGTSHVRIGDAP